MVMLLDCDEQERIKGEKVLVLSLPTVVLNF